MSNKNENLNLKDKIKSKELPSRHVSINRSLSPKDALKETGRKHFVNDDVVDAMPSDGSENAEVFFFSLNRFISDDSLKKEYANRGLIPCDPYILAKINKDTPEFGDDYPNATHWQDSNDKWCFASFGCWDELERRLHVDHGGLSWLAIWWFAGVRK